MLEANADELVDICQVLQVEKVHSFAAKIKLKLNVREHLLKIWGNVTAELELKSVISLENFTQNYEVPFELFLTPKLLIAIFVKWEAILMPMCRILRKTASLI